MKQLTVLAFTLAVFGLILGISGCGGSKKKSSSSGGGTGAGTGTGGTGSGTGGGNGGGGLPGDADAVDLEIHIGIDVPMSALEGVKSRIEGINAHYWKSTEGQSYFQKVTIRDNSKEQGRVNYPKGRIYMSNTDGTVLGNDTPGPGAPGGCCAHTNAGDGIIYLVGQFNSHMFLHEWGHFFMNRHGEEYSCSECWMSSGGPGTPQNCTYCDASNCSVGAPCWEDHILKNLSGWEHPASFDPNSPAPQFDIQDN